MPDISETLRNMNDIFLSTVYATYFTLENDYVVQVFTATLLLLFNLLLFNLFNISFTADGTYALEILKPSFVFEESVKFRCSSHFRPQDGSNTQDFSGRCKERIREG